MVRNGVDRAPARTHPVTFSPIDRMSVLCLEIISACSGEKLWGTSVTHVYAKQSKNGHKVVIVLGGKRSHIPPRFLKSRKFSHNSLPNSKPPA